MFETLYLKTETVVMEGCEYWRQTLVERQGLCIVATCKIKKVGSCHEAEERIDLSREIHMGRGVADGCVIDLQQSLLRRLHDYCHELKTYHGV